MAVLAVFSLWNSPHTIKYRNINQTIGLKGTAVNVQAMVFGNMGSTSGTGVLFTRNPSNGENKLYGEFLINAQVCVLYHSAIYLSRIYCTSCVWHLNIIIKCFIPSGFLTNFKLEFLFFCDG